MKTVKLLIQRLILCMVVSISFTLLVSAQSNSDLKFRSYSIEQGLSQASAICMLQDSSGYIWIGTQDGLNRFDGYNFTIFRHSIDDSTSLSSNGIVCIIRDEQSRIWVGTQGGGLSIFNPQTQTFTHFQHEPNNPKSLSNNTVLSIYQDHKKRIWVGTDNGGLNLFDSNTHDFLRFQHDPNNPESLSNNTVHCIYEDHRNRIWIGTDGGLNLFNPMTQNFSNLQNDRNSTSSLSSNVVWCITQDNQKRIWVGTRGGGLNLLDSISNTFVRFQHDPSNNTSISGNSVFSLYQDHQNKIWVGTENGLNSLNPDSRTFSRYQNDPNNQVSLSHNVVFSIFQDSENLIWVGTHGGGLNLLDDQTRKFSHFKHDPNDLTSLSNNNVWSIFQDNKNEIWVGTGGGGLNLFNSQSKVFSSFQHDSKKIVSLSNNVVFSIFQDNKKRFWVGTQGGLNKLDTRAGTFSHFPHDSNNQGLITSNIITNIIQDNQNRIWIGTFRSGIELFDPQSKRFTHFIHNPDNPSSLGHNRIEDIFQDSQNRIWVATYGGGLNLMNPETQTFSRFQLDTDSTSTLSSNFVMNIFQDSKGSIWLGTGGGGLNLFDPLTGTFKSWLEEDGLSNNFIYGILEDGQSNLWMSTNNGITKFNPETNKFKKYDKQDGLQSNEFNSWAFLKGKDGKMYFGGINGLTVFHPDSIKDNTRIPRVVITDFLLFNKSVAISDTTVLKQAPDYIKEITLEHDDYIFAFEFSALNFRQPEKNQFAYKLEGFNEDWIYTDYKDRKATYTNVAPGTYTFRVKASNDDGYWNEEGASVQVIILPPWWLTWWAKVLWVILFLITLRVLYVIRVRSLKSQRKQLQEEVETKTRELTEANQEISKQKDNYKTNYESIKTLSEMGSEIISTLFIETISERVYENINALMPAEMFSIALHNEENNSLEFTKSVEAGIVGLERGNYHLQKDKNRLAVICFKRQETVVSNDLLKDYPDYPKAIIGELPQSVVEIPLILQQKKIGVLEVCSNSKQAYTDYHIYILKNLASYISIAIENARTFSRVAKSYENITLLNKIGQDISSNISIENIVHSVYQNINTLMSADRFGIGIIDKGKNSIIFKDYSSNSDKFTSLEFPLDNSDWLAVHCVVNNVEIISGNIKKEYSHYIPTVNKPKANMLLLNSIIVLPILISDKVIGCIGVQSKKIDAYNDYHVNLLHSLSIDVGIALENAKIFNQLEKKSIENKILYELSSNLIKPIELDELLKNTMDAAVELVPNAQSGAIFLLNSENTVLEGKVAHAIPNEQIKEVKLKVGEAPSGRAIAEKRNLIENKLQENLSADKQVFGNKISPIKSIIVVLLKVKEKIIGTIAIDNRDKYNAFTNKDLETLSSLAANASIAIERVKMYEVIESVNSDLMMAYSKLKELDEYKEAMTAMIVHDFKNSLNTVISFSEGAPTERRLKSIRQAGQFMLNMVLNILDVQKFETAKVKLALGNYPIDKVVQEALNQLSYTMEQKSIKLSYLKNDGLLSRMDFDLVTRVIVNILSNAIKYIATNGEIEIITEVKEAFLQVSIKDNGPGIPMDKIHKVFDKYSQIDAKKSGSVRSTGIGLTFCKMVVEAHKGKIDVVSKEGEGSNFYFTLPLIEHVYDPIPLVENLDIHEDSIFILSQKENELLTPYLIELQKWEVYDYSEVTAIIKKIKSKKCKINLWKDKMMKALQNVNEDEYSELVKINEYAE